ncbi:GNAT family N-acetyltransferase [Celerinatantimonas yamalensis]|uniref:GNAT family N-acetyltransferase n=1 Tax=Celerinatantimonas yamalensis TaxID=559956 RepID=A0ABW9G2A2_9GAMM
MTFIRQATPDDVPTILPLVDSYWDFEEISGFEQERVAAQLTCLLSNPNLGAGWIAIVDGVAVGYLLAVHLFSLEYLGLTAEIDEFFVLPSQRGNGIGAKLLTVAESEFVQRGCTNMSLQLSRGNNSARDFYHSLGYADRPGYELLDKSLNC